MPLMVALFHPAIAFGKDQHGDHPPTAQKQRRGHRNRNRSERHSDESHPEKRAAAPHVTRDCDEGKPAHHAGHHHHSGMIQVAADPKQIDAGQRDQVTEPDGPDGTLR